MGAENPNAKPLPVVPPDKVIIAVGDVSLTAAQFDQIVEALPAQYRAQARGAGRKQLADNIVQVLVLSQEGKRRKLTENPAYQTQAMFQSANLLAGLTYQTMAKDVTFDEAALRKYYDEHKQDYELVKARHILIRMQGSPVAVKPGQKDLTEAEALAKATELRKKIAGGADFAAVATSDSDDAATASRGGDLGLFRKGQRGPAFDEAAFGLKPGEMSEPVKSPQGYHLIKVESHEMRTFEQARPEIENRMRPEAAQKELKELREKATVKLDPEFFGTAKQ
jgi:peptidyl-prolyl cis-trans isomerase C